MHTARRDSIIYGAATAVLLIALWDLRKVWEERNRRNENQRALDTLSSDDPSFADTLFLKRAHDFRLALVPPQQSNFRVVAIFVLENGQLVFGTNDEPSPNISMALCAERCALLKYRVTNCTEKVKAIYIVTDAETPVTPGTACREYMSGHPAVRRNTRIVMQSNILQSEPLIMSLAELHPCPSIFSGLDPKEQVKLGKSIRQSVRAQLEQFHVEGLSNQLLANLIKAAHQACDMDVRDSLHAIRYGAALAMESSRGDGTVEIIQASQVKALEYSSTLDAVCQLVPQLLSLTRKRTRNKDTPRVLGVVQVDQFGIPHGPFAQARAFLVENGYGDCPVILTTMKKNQAKNAKSALVQKVAARDLAPCVPEFRSTT